MNLLKAPIVLELLQKHGNYMIWRFANCASQQTNHLESTRLQKIDEVDSKMK